MRPTATGSATAPPARPVDYRAYLRSPEWAAKRLWALERAGNACQVCNREDRLDVHHRTYENLGNEKPGDLLVLCSGCHSLYHDRLPQPTKLVAYVGDDPRIRELQRAFESETDETAKLRILKEKADLAGAIVRAHRGAA